MIFYDDHGFAPDPRTCPACRVTDVDIIPVASPFAFGAFDMLCPNCGYRGRWRPSDVTPDEAEAFRQCHIIGNPDAHKRAMKQRARLKDFRARAYREYKQADDEALALTEAVITLGPPTPVSPGKVLPFAPHGPRLRPEERERVTGAFDALDVRLWCMIGQSMLDG